MDDSGPNLGVRAFAALLVAVGLLLLAVAVRSRKASARQPLFRGATSIYAIGMLAVLGAGAIALGLFLLSGSG